MVDRDGFLEWADVFGNLYGTGRQETESRLAAGLDLVLVIDVQGARQVRARMPQAVGIFMLPPSFEILESRLRGRCPDEESVLQRRLEAARAEVASYDEYDYVVVNDELARCVSELCAIVTTERARLARRQPVVDPIVQDVWTTRRAVMTERSKATLRPENSFEYVTIAAARARQLLQGCVPKVDGSLKPARRALQEVSRGFVTLAHTPPTK